MGRHRRTARLQRAEDTLQVHDSGKFKGNRKLPVNRKTLSSSHVASKAHCVSCQVTSGSAIPSVELSNAA
jgi:hypothetical protein